jgi:hypothetical protein
VENVTDGPIGLGTRYEAEFLQGSPMTIELVRFERPVAWEPVGRFRRLDAKGDGRVLASEEVARLVMRMELQAEGNSHLSDRAALTQRFGRRAQIDRRSYLLNCRSYLFR